MDNPWPGHENWACAAAEANDIIYVVFFFNLWEMISGMCGALCIFDVLFIFHFHLTWFSCNKTL